MIEKRTLTPADENWRGYTLDELRYNRAVALARIEMSKEKLKLQAQEMQTHLPGMSANGLMGRIMGSLSYIDYIVIAFRVGRTLTKVFRGFRRRH